MTCDFIDPKTRQYVKGYGLLSFGRNVSNQYERHLLDTRLDVLKTAPKK